MEKLHSLADVAKEVSMDKSNLLKLLKKLDISPVFQRTVESGNQKCTFLTEDGYSVLKNYRSSFSKGSTQEHKIYIVLPDGDARPNRVKVGYSSDFGKRLSTYKTICPETITLRSYDLDRSLEPMFLNIAKKNGTRIGVEVFDIEDMDTFLSKCDTIYEVNK